MLHMPRPRPPHLHCEPSRHGQLRWYVRVGKGPRIRIRAEFGTQEFDAAYQAAVRGERPRLPRAVNPGSLAWMIARYRETTAWSGLSPATRRQRDNIFLGVLKVSGHEPYFAIKQSSIAAGRDRRKDTPAQARNFLDAMRGLFRWALEAQHVKVDPTAGVKNPKRPKGAGFKPWTEADVAAYESHWPIGTRQRVWLAVLLYTGLRRGDAVRIGRQHVRDGVATLYTEKGQGEIAVSFPILPVLQEVLDAGPTGDLSFICGRDGGPMTKESFGNAFSEMARAAGVSKSAHGVRKIAATTAANHGATAAELEAIFGWRGGGMASLYTREADRLRLSKGAMHKLVNEQRTSIPAPCHPSARTQKKL